MEHRNTLVWSSTASEENNKFGQRQHFWDSHNAVIVIHAEEPLRDRRFPNCEKDAVREGGQFHGFNGVAIEGSARQKLSEKNKCLNRNRKNVPQSLPKTPV